MKKVLTLALLAGATLSLKAMDFSGFEEVYMKYSPQLAPLEPGIAREARPIAKRISPAISREIAKIPADVRKKAISQATMIATKYAQLAQAAIQNNQQLAKRLQTEINKHKKELNTLKTQIRKLGVNPNVLGL